MNYMKINPLSISEGPGCRVILFVSGCNNHCKGCHNPESWDFNAGQPFDDVTLGTLLELLSRPYIKGLTLCGGEPLDPVNQPEILEILRKVKENIPNKDIWCYTGYEFAELQKTGKSYTGYTDEILSYITVLITGRFVLEKRDISDNNRWRGSKNQRVVEVQKTLDTGSIVYVGGIPNNN